MIVTISTTCLDDSMTFMTSGKACACLLIVTEPFMSPFLSPPGTAIEQSRPSRPITTRNELYGTRNIKSRTRSQQQRDPPRLAARRAVPARIPPPCQGAPPPFLSPRQERRSGRRPRAAPIESFLASQRSTDARPCHSNGSLGTRHQWRKDAMPVACSHSISRSGL